MSAFYDQASLVVVPSGYKSGKIYAQKPLTTDGQLTFTRASTATRVNASGLIETVASGVPRLDYTDSTCPKLQLEPSRTNLALQSNDVTTSTTNVGYTATANNTTSPDGTANADRIMEDTGTLHLIQKEFSVGSTTDSYAVSFFVKANGRTSGNILYGLNAPPYASITATFNLTAGTITAASGANGATAGTSKIENYGNGWYRVSVTGVLGTAGTHYVRLQDINGGVAGDPTKGFFVYGFQAELGAHPTTLIPTTTAAVTRLADVAIKTGISSLIGQTEGTLFGELKVTAFDPNGFIPVYLKNTSGSNEVYFWFLPDGKIRASVWNTFTQQAEINTSAGYATIGGTYKFALGYKQNDFVFYVNGVQIGTDTNGTVGAMSDFVLTYVGLATYSYPVNLSQALVFKTRLTNAQLAELTTL